MAIDKSNSPAWVKVVIIVVAAGFVLMVAIPFIGTIVTQPSSTTTAQNDQGSVNASDTLSAISKQFAPATEAIEKQLAADPDNAELLKAQAEQYYSWSGAILNATQGNLTEARPMAVLAVQYYERAFAIAAGDSGDLTDYAAALFYSGSLTKAISVAEGVVAKDAKFAPAFFNLAVFYEQSGRYADAIEAYRTAEKLDPDEFSGEDIAGRISAIQQKMAASPSTTTTP